MRPVSVDFLFLSDPLRILFVFIRVIFFDFKRFLPKYCWNHFKSFFLRHEISIRSDHRYPREMSNRRFIDVNGEISSSREKLLQWKLENACQKSEASWQFSVTKMQCQKIKKSKMLFEFNNYTESDNCSSSQKSNLIPFGNFSSESLYYLLLRNI